MEGTQVVEDFLSSFRKRDMDGCLDCLSDDFEFSGPFPEPLKAQAWMGNVADMDAGIPDIKYNAKVVGVEGDKVTLTTQLSGTHTADLDLTAMGLGVISATGKSFSNPEASGVMTIADGKISSYPITPPEGGGLMGLLAQLGVEPPAQ